MGLKQKSFQADWREQKRIEIAVDGKLIMFRNFCPAYGD